MKVQLIAFTARGVELARRLSSAMEDAQIFCMKKHAAQTGALPVTDLQAWARDAWQRADGLIFIGATGIAVRTIAPLLRKKTVDPAVVVMDEAGNFAISLVSGHLGGANALARQAANLVGATPVITTATDVNGKFAVDVFAKENHLYLTSMTRAKEISAAILAGEKIGLFSDFPLDGIIPEELALQQRQRYNLEISMQTRVTGSLLLVPACITVGIGCKKGTPAEKIEMAVNTILAQYGICRQAVANAASIDLKLDEPGLQMYLRKTGIPVNFYDAQTLNQLPGSFSCSAFVSQITGVDCVCERAAVLGAGGGTLIAKKHASDGVTVALARREMRIQF